MKVKQGCDSVILSATMIYSFSSFALKASGYLSFLAGEGAQKWANSKGIPTFASTAEADEVLIC